VDASHSFAAFDSLCVGFGPRTPPSTHSEIRQRYLLSARRESMNSKRSAADSMRWRSSCSARFSLADWIKWDLTLSTCARTWYRLSVYYPTWAVVSAYLFHNLFCAFLECYGTNVVLLHCGVPVRLLSARVGLQGMLSKRVALHKLLSPSRLHS
jgi:hypothetical protein